VALGQHALQLAVKILTQIRDAEYAFGGGNVLHVSFLLRSDRQMARSLPTGGGAFNFDPSPVQHESFDPLDKRFTIYRAPLRKASVRGTTALQDVCRAGNQS
jgi:hypothetical protein